jgi:hypothetical protein
MKDCHALVSSAPIAMQKLAVPARVPQENQRRCHEFDPMSDPSTPVFTCASKVSTTMQELFQKLQSHNLKCDVAEWGIANHCSVGYDLWAS